MKTSFRRLFLSILILLALTFGAMGGTPVHAAALAQIDTETPTVTPTLDVTETETPTVTPTLAVTETETSTVTPTLDVTETETPTVTPTLAETETTTPTVTATLAVTETATSTVTATQTVTQTVTPTPTAVSLIVTNTNDSGAGSLRQVIADAGIGDTITFDAGLSGGTIHLASMLTLMKNVTIDGSALASKITISGDTDDNGTGDVQVFLVNNAVTAKLDSLVITKGINHGIENAGTLTVANSTISDNSSHDIGGGIYNNTGTLTVTNSTFSNNVAIGVGFSGDGGGIYNENGTLTITDSTFFDNYGQGNGGGIYNDGTLAVVNVTNSTFSQNAASRHGGGGGIANFGTLTVASSTFSGNNAPFGGGIANGGDGTLTVTNSTFSGNHGSYYGGGIINNATLTVIKSTFSKNDGGGIASTGGTVIVTVSTFAENFADDGGGIKNDGTLTVKNSTFSSNSASSAGGGISNAGGGMLTVTNSTFSSNTANNGGGIANSGGTLTVRNSTFSENVAKNGGGGILNFPTDYLGRVSTLNYINTIIANSTAGYDCINIGTLGTHINNLVEDGTCSATFSGDPNLGPLASNGGLTKTHALLAGSSAMDAGNDAACAAALVNNLDQRGNVRPVGAHCDIGAYEAPAHTKVTVTLTSLPAQDGWVLETAENGNIGGTLNNAANTLRLGDNAAKKQYRSILSFNTSSIPDTAGIIAVRLKVKQQSVVGNPVATLYGFLIDIKKGFFASLPALQLSDFQAVASQTLGPAQPAPVDGVYSFNLINGKASINKLALNNGLTQIRLRFNFDDNNDAIANYLSLYSGDDVTAANRPQLVITYVTIP